MKPHKLPQITVLEGLHLARKRECYDEFICSYALAEMLVLRVVKATRKEEKSTRSRGAVRRIVYLTKGPNFDHFSPQPHHELFLRYLREKEEYPLHRIARAILSQGTVYRKEIIEKLLEAKGIDAGGLFFQGPQRRKMRGIVRMWLNKADRELPDWGLKQPSRTRQLLANIGPMVLIAKDLTFEELPHLQKSIEGFSDLPDFLNKCGSSPLYRWGNLKYMPDFTIGKYLDPLMNSFENYKFKKVGENNDDLDGGGLGGFYMPIG